MSVDDLYEQLISRVQALTGVEPSGLRKYLKLLSHPDIIETTKAWLESVDFSSQCTKYEHPWNCAREAEASYQSIKYGWIPGPGGRVEANWCDNCKSKVFGPAWSLMAEDDIRESEDLDV